MSIERIVAEYETCKKASTIGLHLKTIFHWIDVTPHMEEGRQAVYCIEEIFPNFHSIQPSEEEKNSFIIDTGFEEYTYLSLSAPTAEEVPLPIGITFKIGGTRPTNCFRARIYSNRIEFSSNTSSILKGHTVFYDTVTNEASARLKMVIYLIENVPKTKQWYIDNGYLKENK